MYGILFLQDLIRAIPRSGLAKVLSAYLKSDLSRFPSETPEEVKGEPSKEQRHKNTFEDILDEMIVRSHVSKTQILGRVQLECDVRHMWPDIGIILPLQQGIRICVGDRTHHD